LGVSGKIKVKEKDQGRNGAQRGPKVRCLAIIKNYSQVEIVLYGLSEKSPQSTGKTFNGRKNKRGKKVKKEKGEKKEKRKSGEEIVLPIQGT